VANFFLGHSIGFDETNTFQVKFFSSVQILGAKVVGGLWAVECVTYSRNKLTLRTKLRNLHLQSQFSIFDSFRDIRVHTYDFLKFVDDLWALKWV